jgi:hypothetical protein
LAARLAEGAMPELNADIPRMHCSLRAEFLYNMRLGHGDLIPCVVFGVASIPTRALLWHAMLDNGAVIHRLPLSAFVHKVDAPPLPLDHLQLWDCFSHHVSVIEYSYLRGLRCATILKDRVWYGGTYKFTIDWHSSPYADEPGEGGHKCAHIIALNNGCFAAQPNNRMRWFEPAFVTKPFPERPDYVTNEHVWSVENKGQKWATEDSDRMFYDTIVDKAGDTECPPRNGAGVSRAPNGADR